MTATPDNALKTLFDSLEVHWPTGEVTRLPYLWLRDNCGCEQCRIVQTSEKRFMISDVPADLAPVTVDLDGDCLTVIWPDGHETRYGGAEIRHPVGRNGQDWTQWPADFVPRRTAYREFLEDDSVAATMIADFVQRGAAIIDNAPTVPGTLEFLSPRLGPIREVLFARIHDVKVDPRGYNVAHTALELPPHNDFASYSWPPSVQALHMLVNEAAGGESVIVDSWQILAGLRRDQPELFDALCTTPVPFREFDDDTETYAVAPLVRLDFDGNVDGLRFSNQLMQAIDPTRPDVVTFYRAYHELCRRVKDSANQARFRLSAGDILIVAAHRVLHGRRAFVADRKRHLQDAYFELDNIRNHLVVLQRRSGYD